MNKTGQNPLVEIMRVPVPDGKDTRERGIKAQALPMRAAMEWYERAQELEAEAVQASAPAQRADVMLAILDHVCEYDPAWPDDHVTAMRENAGAVQIMNAFETLIEMNDPFAIARQKKQTETERAIGMMEKLGIKLNTNGLATKHLSAISVSSESGSE